MRIRTPPIVPSTLTTENEIITPAYVFTAVFLGGNRMLFYYQEILPGPSEYRG